MPEQKQADKFKQAAREHETDLDEGRWNERVKRIAKQVVEEDMKGRPDKRAAKPRSEGPPRT